MWIQLLVSQVILHIRWIFAMTTWLKSCKNWSHAHGRLRWMCEICSWGCQLAFVLQNLALSLQDMMPSVAMIKLTKTAENFTQWKQQETVQQAIFLIVWCVAVESKSCCVAASFIIKERRFRCVTWIFLILQWIQLNCGLNAF